MLDGKTILGLARAARERFDDKAIAELVELAPASVRAYLARARELGPANPLNSISASDLVAYNSANMPVDDVSTSGGAIDTLRRPDFTQMGANDTVDAKSSSSGDTTQTITLSGRKSDGTIVSETLTLNGTTVVTTTNTYERLLKAELSATCAGTVTVQRHTGAVLIRTIPIGERGFQAIFQQCASDPSVQKDFYMKFFWKNTNGSLALTSSTVAENADPDARITHALAASLNDTASVTNRDTSPGLTFDNSTKNVANSGNLSSGSAQGVWLDLTLPAGDNSHRTTYTSELDGQTV
jgi:hypothetical protein